MGCAMKIDSTEMATAILAKMAIFKPGNARNSQNIQNSRSHLGKITFTKPKARQEDGGELPPELVQAAMLVCTGYGDGDAAKRAMLEDLRHYPPEDYPK